MTEDVNRVIGPAGSRKERGNWWVFLVIAMGIAILLMGTWLIILSKRLSAEEQQVVQQDYTITEARRTLEKRENELRVTRQTNDSLKASNSFLYSKRELTSMMRMRDSIASTLDLPEPGTLAVLLPERDTVMVLGISVRGNRYENVVNLQVARGSGEIMEVSPLRIEKRE